MSAKQRPAQPGGGGALHTPGDLSLCVGVTAHRPLRPGKRGDVVGKPAVPRCAGDGGGAGGGGGGGVVVASLC